VSITLSYKSLKKSISIAISGSKSESNRLLILKSLYPKVKINNLSTSDDTKSLSQGILKTKGIVDVHHAGTAMRFLAAYFASKKEVCVTLTGSKRMQERPIHVLVDALRSLGADIEYVNKEGYPPLKITGKKLVRSSVALNANISSQYISALMLIAPSLPKGLKITLLGAVTSNPYILMTLNLLKEIGVSCHFADNIIEILPLLETEKKIITVESDWSSASYFYSIVALAENLEITIKNYIENSLQGDSQVAKIYELLGVATVFNSSEKTITLKKSKKQVAAIVLDLNNTPDIAQTIVVSCFGLGITCALNGLETLKIKETDRLLVNKNIKIATYQDHRMAMAFAPLAIKIPLIISEPEVVSKSYPTFWNDLEKIGFLIK